jgi:hypothetical protein
MVFSRRPPVASSSHSMLIATASASSSFFTTAFLYYLFFNLLEQFSAFMCAMYFPSCRYRVVTPLCYEDCYSTYTVLRLRAYVFITPHKHTPVTQVLALCLSVSLSLCLSLSTSHIRSLTLGHTMAHQQESRESEICCLNGLRPHTLIASGFIH